MDLYATKAVVNARLVPLVDRLARAGVTPDMVTLAAVPVAVAGGACLLLSTSLPPLLLVVPVLVVLRLLLNLLDGNLARRTGKMHPRGEIYNELGDRLADVAFPQIGNQARGLPSGSSGLGPPPPGGPAVDRRRPPCGVGPATARRHG